MTGVALQNGTDIQKLAFVRSVEMNNYFEWKVMLKNIFYMPGRGYITPFWSLTYEVIFYILAPFLVRKVKLYAIVSFLFFAADLIVPGKIQALRLPVYIHDFLFVYNIYFVAGILLYTNFDRVSAWFSSFSKSLLLTGITGALLLMYALNFYFKIETAYSFMAAALLGVLLIVFFLNYQVRIKWLMNIGKFSYTLYITHLASVFLYLAIYWLLAKPHVPYILNYLIWMPAVFFVLLVARVQYWLVEKRTKNILNLLRSKASRQSNL